MDSRVLLPQPRKVHWQQGVCQGGQRVEIIDSSIPHEQGYRLTITAEKITIVSRSKVGRFYAEQTLAQLGNSPPCLEIEDWPDFPVRGVMLDISRDKVPTLATLFGLVDLLASWKINQLQLYIEHTFAYSQHRTVWENSSPITAEEIQQLDAYCKSKFIDLVPNQNSFGHMERWLKHAKYEHLAEAINGAETPWGFRWKGPFSLCPTDARTLEFLGGLYTELLPNFTSGFFNVGCDETFDIGQGRSRDQCDRIGVHRVYLNFLKQVNQLVKAHGRQMMFWGDVILHQPELIAELPADVIALQWGYEANHSFDKEGEQFRKAGVPYYVCPGTSSWNSIAGRTDNAVANLKLAARSGLEHGAIGYLNTDWGDNGHLQYLPVSYLGFAAGSGFSWCLEANENLDLIAVLNHHAFKDPGGGLGKVVYDLGNVYRVCGRENANGSALFRLLVPPPNDAFPEKGMTEEGLHAAENAVDAVNIPSQDNVKLGLVADELSNAKSILRRCIAIGRERLGLPEGPVVHVKDIVHEHRRLWLERNRLGGLESSVNRLAGPNSEKG